MTLRRLRGPAPRSAHSENDWRSSICSRWGCGCSTRNWRCRYGELDVIAADDAARIVVFVEVKTRTSDRFGGVEQAVTPDKVRRLRRLAGLWLAGRTGAGRRCASTSSACASGGGPIPEITHLQGVG